MEYRSWLQIAAGVICCIILLGGCSSSSFLGRQFENFTAYYNGFYNAKKSFREGQQAIREQGTRPIDRSVYLTLFPEQTAGGGSRFESTIQKSADILRNHPSSKWVDDALLLIGKSYFYQQNYVGAEQKFKEVMALESEYEDEARFWLVRTLMASTAYSEGINVVEERLLVDDQPSEWVPKMQLLLGELFVRQREWKEAVAALKEGLRKAGDSRLTARAQYLLGQVYETLEQYEKAAQAYQQVQAYNPLYELGYAARVNYVRVVGLHLDPESALQVLGEMQRDDKHYNKRGELALLRARILQAADQTYDALALYRTLLYGEEQFAGRADLRDRVHYRLAELYRDQLVNFSMAAAHFDSAAGGAPSALSTEIVQYMPGAITNAEEQARMYQRFSQQMNRVRRMDSLLYLGSLDQAAFDSTIAAIQVRRARKAMARAQRVQEQLALENFQSRTQSLRSESMGNRFGGGQSATAAANSEAGFLFHNDPVEVQQNRARFRLRWGDRPLVPNWRRSAAIRGTAGGGPTEVAQADSLSDTVSSSLAAYLAPVNTSSVPRDSTARAQMRAERAEAWYQLGNTLFLLMNRPDSAVYWYRKVIKSDEDRPVARRAYYALSQVYLSTDNTASAHRIYQYIIDNYPDSRFARRARLSLSDEVTTSTAALRDSLQRAQQAYAAAFHTWRVEKSYAEALDRMLSIARTFSTTSVAPRALLAAGYIYLEWAQQANLDPQAAIPLREPSLCCSSLSSLVDEMGSSKPLDTLFTRPLYLESLYASIEAIYPESPHAERAHWLRTSLLPAMETDSLAPAPDSVAVAPAPDSAALQDTTRQVAAPRSPDGLSDAVVSRSAEAPRSSGQSSSRQRSSPALKRSGTPTRSDTLSIEDIR